LAFVDEAKLHMDTGFRNITNDLAADLFGTGTGSRGQISSITLSGANTSVVIDLTNQADTTKFEVGMLMVASATDGSAPSSDTVLISQIDRIDGILTGISSVSPSNTLSANWAANGFLSVAGDLPAGGASGTGSFLKVSGLSAWVPSVAPVSGSSFWNVDRSPDQRLYGIFKDYSDRPIEEALIDLNAQMYLMGASSDYVFVNPISYASLEKSLGAKVQYVDVHHDEVDISFEGIQISGQTGKLTVIADRNCPAQTAFMLQLDTWKVKSLGKAPHVLTYGLEGLEGLRVGTADALEIRIGYYGNLCSNAPGWNGRCKLSM
jgi:hypothetical protein